MAEEKDLYILDQHYKITEERKFIQEPGTVKVNEQSVVLPSGYQNIYRLYRMGDKFLQISFFTKTDSEDEDFIKLRKQYLETMCKAVTEPLLKFMKSFEKHVAFQA